VAPVGVFEPVDQHVDSCGEIVIFVVKFLDQQITAVDTKEGGSIAMFLVRSYVSKRVRIN
jgi:hypothetical protein